jgi:hypothetical protein
MIEIDINSFSHGQIVSKIWLCEQLEKYAEVKPHVVYVLACWHNVTGFLLESRGRLNIKTLHGSDIDASAIEVARLINSAWVYPYKHRYSVEDAAQVSWDPECSIVVNTSAEHFENTDWYYRIPAGTLVAIQESRMPPDKDFNDGLILKNRNNINEFDQLYPMSETRFLDEISIEYPNWSYVRYMKIGII